MDRAEDTGQGLTTGSSSCTSPRAHLLSLHTGSMLEDDATGTLHASAASHSTVGHLTVGSLHLHLFPSLPLSPVSVDSLPGLSALPTAVWR